MSHISHVQHQVSIDGRHTKRQYALRYAVRSGLAITAGLPFVVLGSALTATVIGAPIGLPLVWLGCKPYLRSQQRHLAILNHYMQDPTNPIYAARTSRGRIDEDIVTDINSYQQITDEGEDQYLS